MIFERRIHIKLVRAQRQTPSQPRSRPQPVVKTRAVWYSGARWRIASGRPQSRLPCLLKCMINRVNIANVAETKIYFSFFYIYENCTQRGKSKMWAALIHD